MSAAFTAASFGSRGDPTLPLYQIAEERIDVSQPAKKTGIAASPVSSRRANLSSVIPRLKLCVASQPRAPPQWLQPWVSACLATDEIMATYPQTSGHDQKMQP